VFGDLGSSNIFNVKVRSSLPHILVVGTMCSSTNQLALCRQLLYGYGKVGQEGVGGSLLIVQGTSPKNLAIASGGSSPSHFFDIAKLFESTY